MYELADIDVSHFKELKLVDRDFLAILPMNCRSKKCIKNFSTYYYTE